MKLALSLCLAIQAIAHAQITILSTPWPTGRNPDDSGGLVPGGLISIVCTGLTVPKPLIRPQEVPLPFEVAGIRVRVGQGPYCNGKDSPGLEAPILEVVDQGDYQQVTVQVPWEYENVPLNQVGAICNGLGPKNIIISQGDQSATSPPTGRAGGNASSAFFKDHDGYALAQHADLSWVTLDKPSLPGETIYLHMTNLGMADGHPPTGFPTPLLFSTTISESGNVRGPIPLYTRYTKISFGLALDQILVASAPVLSISLTPGAVSRYTAVVQIPKDLPSFQQAEIYYVWLYCPGSASVIPFCTGGMLVASDFTKIRIAAATN